MTEQDRDKQKAAVVAEIVRSKGFKTVACTNVGLNPRTFRQWKATDAEIRQAVAGSITISAWAAPSARRFARWAPSAERSNQP